MMNIEEIKKILPHRPPFLFVDEVLEVSDERILAKRLIRDDEYFFTGHFPGEPIMPGVLMVEAIAQAGGVMLLRNRRNAIPLFMAIDRVRFRKIVKPGDTLILEARLLQDRGKIVKITGTATVNDSVVCEATILAGIKE
ncbi:MAG: 3-hydroxyacyl-ACP dehydratase FabZ [candidate division WOR-3 bacterium]|nr:MAG: 3-hydroxyacyl-ACP dehydratase FabZ [candidate division WOR-3 bacterium]